MINSRRMIRTVLLGCLGAAMLWVARADASGCRGNWQQIERRAVYKINHASSSAETFSNTYKWKLMGALERTTDPQEIQELGDFYKALVSKIADVYCYKILFAKKRAYYALTMGCGMGNPGRVMPVCCPYAAQRIENLAFGRIGWLKVHEEACCAEIQMLIDEALGDDDSES